MAFTSFLSFLCRWKRERLRWTEDSLGLALRSLLFQLGFKVVWNPTDALLTRVTLTGESHFLSLSFLICSMGAVQTLPP